MQNQSLQNAARTKYVNNQQQEIPQISMPSNTLQNSKSEAESGRLHIAFDQDVEIPDIFVCRGR